MPKRLTSGPGPRGALLDRPEVKRQWEVCTIWDYAPAEQTYTIVSGISGVVPDVRRLVQDPGDISVLPRGAEVVVHYELGFPAIAYVIKSAWTNAVSLNQTQLTEVRGVGGESPIYTKENTAANVRPPDDPIDVIGGDWGKKGNSGNFVGILAGGTNVVSSGPMAQIRTHGVNDTVEIISNEYRHISSMGNMSIRNDGGKTSLTWVAGADQMTENGANTENWTIRLDVGAEGDLFKLMVTTPHNNELCSIHMSGDGRLSVKGVAGVDISSGPRGTYREDIGEDRESVVLGSSYEAIGDRSNVTIGGDRITSVTTSDNLSVGNDYKHTIGNDHLVSVLNRQVVSVTGSDVAIECSAPNGRVETITGKGHLTLNESGDHVVSVPSTGKVHIISPGADSVILGADGTVTKTPDGHQVSPITAQHHVAMYEELKVMLDTLLTWCDTHTHLSAVGPTGPASAAATGAASTQVSPKIPAIQSKRVLVGS